MFARRGPKTPATQARPSKLYYGWIIVVFAGMVQFLSAPGQNHSISVFFDPMIEGLGLSRTMMSSMYAAGSMTAALTVVGLGKLLDRYGARVMMGICTALFVASVVVMGLVENPWQLFLAFAFLRNMGQGAMLLIPTTLLALWFIRLRGRVMSLAALGLVANQAVVPPFNKWLIDSFGWREAWFIWAGIVFLTLLPTSIILVRRSPESMGLLPDGAKAPPIVIGAEKPVPVVREDTWTLSEALRTRTLWLLVAAGVAQPMIFSALVLHNTSILGTRGLDPDIAPLVLTMIAPLVLFGNFLGGYLIDKVENRYVLAITPAVMALALVWNFALGSTWQALVYGGLIGLSIGMGSIASNVIWPNYFGRANLGAIRGVGTTTIVVFSAIGPLPFGALYDLTESYNMSLVVFMALPVMSIAAAFLARPPLKGGR
ncbi:MAG: MFS transporter [SAR202 cluster bacterium]|nr:MFS transporter [SAR202 cluster bacterium]